MRGFGNNSKQFPILRSSSPTEPQLLQCPFRHQPLIETLLLSRKYRSPSIPRMRATREAQTFPRVLLQQVFRADRLSREGICATPLERPFLVLALRVRLERRNRRVSFRRHFPGFSQASPADLCQAVFSVKNRILGK